MSRTLSAFEDFLIAGGSPGEDWSALAGDLDFTDRVEMAAVAKHRGREAFAAEILSDTVRDARRTKNGYALFALSSAYQMMLGQGSLEEQSSVARQLLEESAELAFPEAQATLAHWYHHGLNGAVKSEAKFVHWVLAAIRNGNELAAAEYASYLVRNREQVPTWLLPLALEGCAHIRGGKALRKKLESR